MRIALLDDAGVLSGYDEVDKVPKGAVEVPQECDLEPGKYRWDGHAFWPVRAVRAKRKSLDQDELMRGLVLAVDALLAGRQPSATAVAAIAKYKATYDAKEPD